MGLTMRFTLASSVHPSLWPGVGLAEDCSENMLEMNFQSE